MYKIQCDHCEQLFSITEIKTEKSTRLPGNITRHYFECPGCQHEYTSYFLDNEMRQMQLEIKYLQNKTELKIKQKNKLLKLTRKLTAMNQQYLKVYNEMVENNA